MIAALLVGGYLTGYALVFRAVFLRLDAYEVEPGNPMSAALIALFWPAWVPGLALWWITRGRRMAGRHRVAETGPESDH